MTNRIGFSAPVGAARVSAELQIDGRPNGLTEAEAMPLAQQFNKFQEWTRIYCEKVNLNKRRSRR
jgi:hypothetical protein